MRPPPSITVQTGKLEALSSGSIVFDPADGVVFKVGALTIKLAFLEGDSDSPGGKPSTKKVPEPESLTLRYEFYGKLPCSPMSFFSINPQEIGMANGNKIFFAWHVSKLHSSHPSVQLTYTIYREHEVAVAESETRREEDSESNDR